jgi:hypothetical protein
LGSPLEDWLMSGAQRPDVERILDSLKDFQRETVDWVYRRMYQDADCTRRFLLADEVGLGKTLVARGLTALAIDRLWDTTERIDVIYICSNADIARQNISRLNVSGQQDYQLASRVTMLPVELHNLRGNKLNFVSLTPSTSFDLRSSLGTVNERALLYGLLRGHWQLGNRVGPLNVLQGFASAESFREHAHDFSNHREIDEVLAAGFLARLDELARACQADAKPDMRARFEALCERFARSNSWRHRASRRSSRISLSSTSSSASRTCSTGRTTRACSPASCLTMASILPQRASFCCQRHRTRCTRSTTRRAVRSTTRTSCGRCGFSSTTM